MHVGYAAHTLHVCCMIRHVGCMYVTFGLHACCMYVAMWAADLLDAFACVLHAHWACMLCEYVASMSPLYHMYVASIPMYVASIPMHVCIYTTCMFASIPHVCLHLYHMYVCIYTTCMFASMQHVCCSITGSRFVGKTTPLSPTGDIAAEPSIRAMESCAHTLFIAGHELL